MEESEYVAFTFDTSDLPADVVVGSPDQHLLTLTDNDGYRVEFSTASQTVGEDALECGSVTGVHIPYARCCCWDHYHSDSG